MNAALPIHLTTHVERTAAPGLRSLGSPGDQEGRCRSPRRGRCNDKNKESYVSAPRTEYRFDRMNSFAPENPRGVMSCTSALVAS
ncbi:MAG: hypothetical protein JWR35_1158 [Marmoricola sp.]|jgi:hypothetical protein|nr:hypothetical protein [Marmoricola sp.]